MNARMNEWMDAYMNEWMHENRLQEITIGYKMCTVLKLGQKIIIPL
jgi:hypothetical protein